MSSDRRVGSGVYTRQNFLSMYLPSITLAVGTGLVIPALPVYARNFGVSFEVASLIIIAQQLGSTLSALPVGLLMDRFGRRNIVLIGPLLLAASSLLMVRAETFGELLAYRFIAGVGEQMWRTGRLTMIADTGALHERGRQITTMSAMESSGRLLSPALGGLLAGFLDVRAPFVAHAVLSLVAILPSFVLIRETAPHLVTGGSGPRPPGTGATGYAAGPGGPHTPPRDAKGSGYAAAPSGPGFGSLLTFQILVFFLAQVFASLTRGPIFTGQINLYGAFAYQLDPQTIGVMATLATAFSIPISISSGHIMDRFGRKTTLVPGFTLLAVAMAFMAATAYLEMPFNVFIVAYFAVHATNSITGGNMQTLGSDIAPEHARGRFYGVWHTLGSVGGPIGTSGFAGLSGLAGYWSAFGFLGATAAGAAFILGALVHAPKRDDPGHAWRAGPAQLATGSPDGTGGSLRERTDSP